MRVFGFYPRFFSVRSVRMIIRLRAKGKSASIGLMEKV